MNERNISNFSDGLYQFNAKSSSSSWICILLIIYLQWNLMLMIIVLIKMVMMIMHDKRMLITERKTGINQVTVKFKGQ